MFRREKVFANGFWLNFVIKNPTIEPLYLKLLEHNSISGAQVGALLVHPSLKNLKIRGTFKQIKDIYDKIKLDYGKLKTLDLRTTEWYVEASFVFPADPKNETQQANFLIRKAMKSFMIDKLSYCK